MYVTELHKKLSLSPGEETIKYREPRAVVITAAVHSGGPGFDPGGRPPWGGFLWFPSPPPGE